MNNNDNLDKFTEAYSKLGSEETHSRTLTVTDIIDIHNRMIDIYGGSYGIRDNSLLESICVAPNQNIFGYEPYPTIYEKASKYLFDFANYQAFIDGNKRTGLAVCSALLSINGFDLNLSSTQAYILVLDIANHRYKDSSEVSEIIKNNIVFKKDYLSDPELKSVEPEIEEDEDIDI